MIAYVTKNNICKQEYNFFTNSILYVMTHVIKFRKSLWKCVENANSFFAFLASIDVICHLDNTLFNELSKKVK